MDLKDNLKQLKIDDINFILHPHLKHALKAIGTHKVEIKLKEGVTSSINVRILPEGAVIEEEAAAAPADAPSEA